MGYGRTSTEIPRDGNETKISTGFESLLLSKTSFSNLTIPVNDLSNVFQDGKVETATANLSNSWEKDPQLAELDATKEQLEDLSKRYQDLERKSKADIKILVKEVKSLRSSQAALKEQLNQSLKEKSEIEVYMMNTLKARDYS